MKFKTLAVVAGVSAPLILGGMAAGPGCLPDFDNSGDVGVVDLLTILASLGPCEGCPADINNDGTVNVLDLVMLLDCWGPCPCRAPINPEIFDATEIIDVTDAGAAAAGLLVTHLYATGAAVNVGDALLAAQADLNPNLITNFYQDLFGTDIPPLNVICDAFPTSCYDTFVTMREIVDDSSPVLVTPGFSMSGVGLNGSWFVAPGEPDREAVDISGVTGNPGQAGVLVAQITLVRSTPAGGPSSVGYSGTMNMWAGGAGGEDGAQSKFAFLDCPWDVEPPGGDGIVGITDFLVLLAQWGTDPGGPPDFDGDGNVGIVDFLELLANWGLCP